ncbi:MAG: bifunctional DNA-formamidopyrimidine glycosylase/DNA-(apurinic or apyrimidinic site) lyase [Pseudomonadota bacterium]
MPELPEVETVRRGLAPVMEGATFSRVRLKRKDLRFALPKSFAKRLEGAHILSLSRRGKYMNAALSTGETLIMHLGMTGRFTIEEETASAPGRFHHEVAQLEKHDHVVFEVARRDGRSARIFYNDARRFGFMDLSPTGALDQSRHFAGMGPEPLSEGFTETSFNAALKKRSAPIKAALLDQRVVAGVGNIYACEALFRAKISPRRKASSVAGVRARRLRLAVIAVLEEAIEAGGSTLRDFAASDGALGYFQHNFKVYGREAEPCPICKTPVKRLEQAGRSTFFCGVCQR